MTSNPLARRQAEATATYRELGLTAQQEADRRNRLLFRDDIEWAVGESGLYLRDKPSWTARRTRELEAEAESQRTQWKHRQTQGDE